MEALSRRINYSPQYISDVELAKTTVSRRFAVAVDRALEAGDQIVALHPAVVIEREIERQRRADARREALRSVQEADDVKRRGFIGLGLSVVLLGPEGAAHASADDWDRIGHAWGYEIATASDRSALLPGLAADLKRLQTAGGPQRTIALLSSYVAEIAVSSGDSALAKRWWRRARMAATGAADPHLTAYVTGRQAVAGLYGAYGPAQVLTLADDALSATSAPPLCRTFLLCLRARTGVWLDAGEHERWGRDWFPGASRRRAQGNRSRASCRGGLTRS